MEDLRRGFTMSPAYCARGTRELTATPMSNALRELETAKLPSDRVWNKKHMS